MYMKMMSLTSVWISLMLELVLCHSTVTEGNSCEPIRIPLCLDESIPYNMTRFPNQVGQAQQVDAGHKVHEFYPLIQVGCSPQLRLLVCSRFVPMCSETDLATERLPCKAVCDKAKTGCEPLLTRFGFQWPSELVCDNLPQGGDCITDDTEDGPAPGCGSNIREASVDDSDANCNTVVTAVVTEGMGKTRVAVGD